MKVDESCKTATGSHKQAQQNSAKFTIKQNYKLCLSDWETSLTELSCKLSLLNSHLLLSSFDQASRLVIRKFMSYNFETVAFRRRR